MATALNNAQRAQMDQEKAQKKFAQDQAKDQQGRATTINFPNVEFGQNVPLMDIAKQPPQGPPQSQAEQFGMGALQQAKTQYGSGFQPSNLQQTQDLAAQFAADPSLGRDDAAIKERAMASFNRDFGKTTERYRRDTGGVAGTQARSDELINRFVGGAAEKAQLGAQMDVEADERKRRDLGQAIQVTQGLGQYEQGIFQGNIDALIQQAGSASAFAEMANQRNILLDDQEFKKGMAAFEQEGKEALQAGDFEGQKEIIAAEQKFNAGQAKLGREFTANENSLNRIFETSLKHLDQEGLTELTKLQGEIEKGLLIDGATLDSAEAQLDRLHNLAMQQGDIAGQKEIQAARDELETIREEAAREFASTERQATEAWRSGERLSEQDFARQEAFFKQQENLALQNNDLNAQIVIADMRNKSEMNKLTAGMNHDEKMANINAAIQEAKDQNDSARLKSLYQFQTAQDITKMEKNNQFVESQMVIKNQLDKALQDNEFVHANTLQNMRLEQEMEIYMKENELKQIGLELKKRGMDMSDIQTAVANGQMDPQTAIDFMKKNLPPDVAAGIKTPDPMAVQLAIAEDFKNMRYQFAQTHPGAWNEETQKLNPEFESQFNEWVNENVYDKDGGLRTIPSSVSDLIGNTKPDEEEGPIGDKPDKPDKPEGLIV